MTRQRRFAGAPNEAVFAFCQGIAADGLVAISGQVGKSNRTGEMIGPTRFDNRLERSFANVREIADDLAGSGARLVHVQAHVAEPLSEVWAELAAGHRRALGANLPACSVVPVMGLSRPEYLVEVSAVATDQPVLSVADTGPLGAAFGTSQATRVGQTVFVSGQLPVTAEGEVRGTTVPEQLEIVLGQVCDALAAAGASPSDVTTENLWIAERPTPEGFEALAAVNRSVFAECRPSSTLVFVPELPFGALVQVSAVAVIARSESTIEVEGL